MSSVSPLDFIAHHRIEYGEQFARSGDHGGFDRLAGNAQAFVEDFENRIASAADQSSHVQRATHHRPAPAGTILWPCGESEVQEFGTTVTLRVAFADRCGRMARLLDAGNAGQSRLQRNGNGKSCD